MHCNTGDESGGPHREEADGQQGMLRRCGHGASGW